MPYTLHTHLCIYCTYSTIARAIYFFTYNVYIWPYIIFRIQNHTKVYRGYNKVNLRQTGDTGVKRHTFLYGILWSVQYCRE